MKHFYLKASELFFLFCLSCVNLVSLFSHNILWNNLFDVHVRSKIKQKTNPRRKILNTHHNEVVILCVKKSYLQLFLYRTSTVIAPYSFKESIILYFCQYLILHAFKFYIFFIDFIYRILAGMCVMKMFPIYNFSIKKKYATNLCKRLKQKLHYC